MYLSGLLRVGVKGNCKEQSTKGKGGYFPLHAFFAVSIHLSLDT
jgi:hypothetical protein